MIYKNQFEKLLKLIDAGIIGSQDLYQESISSTDNLINTEDFNLTITFGTDSDTFTVNKETSNIDLDIESIDIFLQDLRNKESLRIGKNSFTFDWNLEIIDYEIKIENMIFGNVTDKTLKNSSIIRLFSSAEYLDNTVQTYLNDSFQKIFNELKNPGRIMIPDLNFYFDNLDVEDYKNLIENINIVIVYGFNITIEKDIKGVG